MCCLRATCCTSPAWSRASGTSARSTACSPTPPSTTATARAGDDAFSDGDRTTTLLPPGGSRRMVPGGVPRRGCRRIRARSRSRGSTTQRSPRFATKFKHHQSSRDERHGSRPRVPRSTALMEIQMLARSRAIGGVAGAGRAPDPGASRPRVGKVAMRPLQRRRDRATSCGRSASESEGGGERWSSGGELGRARRGGRRSRRRDVDEGNADGPDAETDAATGLRRRRRPLLEDTLGPTGDRAGAPA